MKIQKIFAALCLASGVGAAETWTVLNSGSSQNLASVSCGDSTTCYAAGNLTSLLKTTDGGMTWTSAVVGVGGDSSGDGGNPRSVLFLHPDTGYYVRSFSGYHPSFGTLSYAHILRTTNGGGTWAYSYQHGSTTGIRSGLRRLHFLDSKTGYAVGWGRPWVLVTWNGGLAWQERSSSTTTIGEAINACFLTTSVGYAVGQAGSIRKTLNGGSLWTAQVSNVTVNLNGIHFLNTDIGYVVGDSGVILKTTDGGGSWQLQPSGTTRRLHAVRFADLNVGYAVGDSGILLATVNGGSDWMLRASGNTRNLKELILIQKGVSGFAVGDSGTIIKMTAGIPGQPVALGGFQPPGRRRVVPGVRGPMLSLPDGRVFDLRGRRQFMRSLVPSSP